jgi:1,4-dihydroxy-2-naphthoyl-CoA hydrolase
MSVDTKKNIAILEKAVKEKQKSTLLHALGIEMTYIGEDKLSARMPVDERTVQFYGMLHGGASVAMAETLASMGASIFIDPETQIVVGQEINANHIRSMTSGFVTGEAKPMHLGRTSQIWQTEIKNEEGKLVCISRMTIAVVPKRV